MGIVATAMAHCRPPDIKTMPHQLDIFDDSRDVGLRNDLAQALLDGQPDAAQAAARTLQAEFGGDTVLAPAALLIEHLVWQRSITGPLDVAALLDARRRLEGPIAAAAAAALGARDAAAWLQGQWRWLADRAAAVGWQPAQADAHAAALYLRAQAWQAAAQAVARIESWRRIPVPLLWMTQARWRSEGADAAWPLLAEALWLAPARAAALLPQLADARLDKLVARFEAQFDSTMGSGEEWAWLPAFVLVEQPLLAAALAPATAPAEAPPGQAFGVVMALLRLERQGLHHEIVAQRARLRALSAALFAAYMAPR